MNQILLNKMSKIVGKKIYFIQFFIIFIITLVLIFYQFFQSYLKNTENYLSEITAKNYSLLMLYNNQKNDIFIINNSLPVIGLIEIPKINILYPIISECSSENLKISVCKFYGPSVNKIGNLCIAGHNYDNDIFFSNLHLLEISDTINIYDIHFNEYTYIIYKIYEINPEDLSCLSQITDR